MFNQPWGYPAPQQPVIFIPSPGAPTPGGLSPQTAAEQILAWKQVEKMLKGDDKKDDKPKGKTDGSVIGMMLFMILMSPITGPIVFWFYQQSHLMMSK